jgi:signal transduction histidine kinase
MGYRGTSKDVSELAAVDQLKNEFISTVSHELRTPLTSIRGSLGLLSGGAFGELPQQAGNMIDIACKNCQRLIDLVNDILDMEKIESGRMDYSFDVFDLDSLVSQAIQNNQDYGEEFDISFLVTETVPSTTVFGDARKISQVLTNLLSNAAKFSPSGDHVEVSVSSNRETYRVTVKDNGAGIPVVFRNHIFEKFTRADSSDVRETAGTGLGLSISKAIIERHDGYIGFESVPMEGAVFFFDLPIWRGETPTQNTVQ